MSKTTILALTPQFTCFTQEEEEGVLTLNEVERKKAVQCRPCFGVCLVRSVWALREARISVSHRRNFLEEERLPSFELFVKYFSTHHTRRDATGVLSLLSGVKYPERFRE